ncbi:biotin/lipoyl-containing protein, partial [Leucobacter albus]
MSNNEFLLPDVGEGLTEAEIVTWAVQPGDTVHLNQVICEIETEKSLVEIPSPFEGEIAELLVETGTTVPVGTAILRMRGEGDNAGEGGGSGSASTGSAAASGSAAGGAPERAAQADTAGGGAASAGAAAAGAAAAGAAAAGAAA